MKTLPLSDKSNDDLEEYLGDSQEFSDEAGRVVDVASQDAFKERPPRIESELAGDRPLEQGVQGSGAVDTADPLTIAQRDNTRALAGEQSYSRDEYPLLPELRKRLTQDLEQAGAKAPAPTDSGGLLGATMEGGGQLGDPETTDDRMGNPGGTGPKVLEVGPDPDKEAGD